MVDLGSYVEGVVCLIGRSINLKVEEVTSTIPGTNLHDKRPDPSWRINFAYPRASHEQPPPDRKQRSCFYSTFFILTLLWNTVANVLALQGTQRERERTE